MHVYVVYVSNVIHVLSVGISTFGPRADQIVGDLAKVALHDVSKKKTKLKENTARN